MAVKKHKLDVSIEEDFCLLGMVADEPDYKLCWMINNALELAFEKLDDLQLFHRKLQVDQVFSIFGYQDEDALLTYRIINNKSDRGYFLDELKNLDFLVHIQGEISSEKINSFLHHAGALPQVRLCVPVDLKKIRNKERLLLW
ncbi:MAG: IPExxxVDY family protein [Bacteroidales bacterium]|nr:IPExxxVDY family protein [Bacteroidales bacterium]